MAQRLDPVSRRWLPRTEGFAGIAVMVLGLVVLAGWLVSPAATSLQRMKFSAASGLVLAWLFVATLVRAEYLHVQLRHQNRELTRLSRTDPVTGAFNRRHLGEGIAGRYEDTLAVLMIDVDRFKQVNDRHGHQSGDVVLRAVAQRLQAMLRAGDTLIRWGGDEFLVLLPRTHHLDAANLAERLRAAVADDPIAVSGPDALRVTISIGVASVRGLDPVELIACADRGLYEAKAAGRNSVSVAGG